MFFVKLDRSKIKVTGGEGKVLSKDFKDEHIAFLHNLLSNDIKNLKNGEFNYNLRLTPNGHPEEEFFVYRIGNEFLLDTPADAKKTIEEFQKLKLSLKVFFEDKTPFLSHYFVFGEEINTFIRKKFGISEDFFQFKTYKKIIIARNPLRINKNGYDLIGPEEEIREHISTLQEISYSDFNNIRIKNCMPAIYKELNEKILPNETGFLEYMVSLTKGCYVGQEAVARVYYRGTPPRVLIKFLIKKKVQEGDEIFLKDRKVGFITSVTSDGRWGLGYVLRNIAEKGKTLKVKDDKGYIKIEDICKPAFK